MRRSAPREPYAPTSWLAPESKEQIGDHGKHHAYDEHGHDWEEEPDASAFNGQIAGEPSQPRELSEREQDGTRQDQQHSQAELGGAR